MRLTVGPLSPSVYWRRRAVVVGAVLAVVLILAYSCSGGEEPKKKPGAAPTGEASQPGTGETQSQPTLITPNASDPSSGQPAGNPGPDAGVTGEGATGDQCTDAEMSVVSAAESTSVRQGVPTKFYIRIKNISTRTCSRDVGAQAQELYLMQNGTKQWSSDACGNTGGNSDVRVLPPNIEREYYQFWNGQATAQGCTNPQMLPKGTYELRGRLGQKVSEPVTVTITG
jgi:hypothetical protein